MIGLALIVAVVTATAAVVVVGGLRLLPTVRLQLAGLALCCVVLPLVAVLLSGWVMFGMGDDVKILAVSSAAASAAVAAGVLLGRSLGNRLDRLRRATREFARGDLTARTPVTGPAELAELAAAFNDMASRLTELFDSRSELVAWASHDLRTPIASLKAMLEALEDGVAEPEEYLPALRTQVETLEALVEDLFDVALLDAGAVTLDVRESDVAEVVRRCVEGLQAEADAAGVRIETSSNGPAPAVCAPDKVDRVLKNLLTNALRHTPAEGSVIVSVATVNGYARVTVDDTGEGVAPQAQQRMFERFWRGDAARTEAGAGLGLTIARGLVRAQGGEIWAEPRQAGGTRVAFTLPRSLP
jgi:two-component system, OmpR family, sensor histidine kinase SaeS